MATLEGGNVHRERVIDEDLLDRCILADNPLNVEEIVLVFFVEILRILWVILFIFIFTIIRLLLLKRLCIGEVEFDLVLGDLRSFTENHAPNAFIDIQVLAKILGNMPLEHKLIVLLAEILDHELVAATVDFRQLCDFFSLGFFRD